MKFVAKYIAAMGCAAFAALVIQVLPQEARTRDKLGHIAGAVLHGRAEVIDGDTLRVTGQRVRLEGIDAPEINQLCLKSRSGSGAWPAGRIAAAALRRLVHGRTVTCERIGRDGYGRVLGRCSVAGVDLNALMIRRGLAWAFRKYSHTFVAEERIAQRARVGVWAARCEPAWAYRANRWRAVASSAPAGCAIKGNITRNGRIYHMPWSPWYGRTRIETAKGERWFCDEGQALAAGWRPAVVR